MRSGTYGIFKQVRERILQSSPDFLAQTNRLGSQLAFDIAATTFKNIQSLLSSIDDDAASLAPLGIWNDVNTALENIETITSSIFNFNTLQPNPAQSRNDLQNRLEIEYTQLFKLLAPLIGIQNGASYLQQYITGISAVELAAKQTADKFKVEMQAQADSLSEILNASRQRSIESTSIVEAEHFSDASTGFRKGARAWLLMTIISGLITIAYCVALLRNPTAQLPVTTAAQQALPKILLFGVLAYAVNVCARNFWANKHNETVNLHRRNAILSYRALVAPASTPEQRDIILTQAATAVFSPQESAYVKQLNSAPDIPATIIGSIVKGAGH